MDTASLTPAQWRQRQNIRNFFLVATEEELVREIAYREARKDAFAVACLRELLEEVEHA